MTPLRIAQVAPVANPIRRDGGDSVEQLVRMLTDGLLERGHDVTLWATGDSETAAELRSVHPRGYDEEEHVWDWYRHESFHAAAPFEHARDYDVIHSHDFHFTLPYARLTDTPLIETAHVDVAPEVRYELQRHPEVELVTVSEHARRAFGTRQNISVIPHGVDFDRIDLGDGSGGYLLFLGRLIPDKGPADAVRLAQAVGMDLVLAGPPSDDYDVGSEVDLHAVTTTGWVDPEQRNELLGGASALLFPNRYPEPFGLVLIEAMAAGTPVLATRLGAAPEIVEEGVTGFTADSWQDLAALVPAVKDLDRARVRPPPRERFSLERMVDMHVALYSRLAARRSAVA